MKSPSEDKLTEYILIGFGIIPVILAALTVAPFLSDGLAGIVKGPTHSMNNPINIQWCADSPKAILVFLAAYGTGIGVYFSTRRNYRRGEEHGSAKWGNAQRTCKKYAEKDSRKNLILTQNVRMGLDGRMHRRNLNVLVVGGSGAGKTRFYAKPNIMQANTSYVVLDPKGEILRDTGYLLERYGYDIKVLDLIHTERSHGFNPFVYLRDDKDVLRLVNNLIRNTTPKGAQSSDPFWERAETALLEALILYLVNEAPPEEQNFSMVMEMINAAEVREDDEEYASVLDELFERLAMRDPEHLAVKQYHIFKLAAGVVCSKRLLNQAVWKSLRTHNLKPKKGAQVMKKNEKITALYERLSRDDFGKDDDQQRESNSISNQELLCRGWFLPPNTYDCGSFVVNGTAVVGKELKHSITAGNQHTKELTFMKSLFEQMGGTYRQVGDYLIPNLSLPEKSDYQIGKYGRLRRNYLKEYHPVLYANFLTSGTLHRHLAEIDQACNERMEIIISDMAKQDGVTETLKVADQMEWVRRMNSIRSRAEEIVLTELVYE